ncbi:MAG TPA: 2Fe-2S iron-sulfur cluster-binding protein, partial [Kribbella sp.]|nr:2Fe-2S iron-sulfur cluster-binding protein [Kribbella sp.]
MTTQALRAPALTVNGDVTPIGDVSVHTTVLDWLRDRGLTGAKEGCAEGECGACSILVARPGTTSSTEWTAVNACLLPVASLDGQEVITSEGLGTADALHPVQQEMAVRGGSQCGFCTPGFICSMAAEYYRPDRACGSAADHEHGPNGFDLHSLSGNLCRCTGYRPIRDAAYALEEPAEDDAFAVRRDSPPPAPAATGMASPEGEFLRPRTLQAALAVLGERDDAVVVAGSTDLGVQVNIFGSRPPLTIA